MTAAATAGARRVIFVLPLAPTVDFRRKFFVDELEASGIRTEYWDIAAVMGYDMRFNADHSGLTCRRIGSMAELERCVEQCDRQRTVFVLQVTRGPDSFRLYRLFTRLQCVITLFGRGYLPSPPAERSLAVLLRKLWGARSPRAVALAVIARLLRGRLPATRPYDLVFAAGLAGRRQHAHDAIAFADLHHFDVDAAAADRAPDAPLPGRMIVFVDDYLPHHPDFAAFGSAVVDAARYYRDLNAYFARLERATGARVVIAAHPKAVYDTNPFEGRLALAGVTSALVRRSELVLAHASTAISLAVIHERPLRLIYTPEIAATHPFLFKSMQMTAEMLGCPIEDIAASPERAATEPPPVDAARYAAYYREYLSIADATIPSATIAVRAFEQLFNAAAEGVADTTRASASPGSAAPRPRGPAGARATLRNHADN